MFTLMPGGKGLKHTLFATICAIFSAAFLNSCGPNGFDGVDDEQLLSEYGFTNPLFVKVPAAAGSYTAPNGQLNPSIDLEIVGYFADQGLVKINPNPDAAPWFEITPVDGAIQNGQLLVPIATRQISSRSQKETWKEGPVEFFAETVAYTLVPNKKFADPPSFPVSLTLRLVLMRDPAVGKWQIALIRGTAFGQDDETIVRNAVTAAAAKHPAVMPVVANNAMLAAFETIQKRLEPEIFLTKDNTVVLRVAKLEFTREAFLAPNFVELYEFCPKSRYAGHADWRMPSLGDILPIFKNGLHGYSDTVKDTPNHRIWGGTFAFGFAEVVVNGSRMTDPGSRRLFLNSFHKALSRDLLTFSKVQILDAVGQLDAYYGEDVISFNGEQATLGQYAPQYPDNAGWGRGAFSRHFGRDGTFGYEAPYEGHTVCVRDL